MLLIRRRGQKVLIALMWLALVTAAAKPQWLGTPIEQQKAGRDLMIAVDLSGSMETRDFTRPDGEAVDRLVAVKTVLGQLANERPGDRLGLIVFGNAAYLQSPFTEDHRAWLVLLDETRIRMAGPSTALGDAVGLRSSCSGMRRQNTGCCCYSPTATTRAAWCPRWTRPGWLLPRISGFTPLPLATHRRGRGGDRS